MDMRKTGGRQSRLAAEPWIIDSVRLDDHVLEIVGWALPPSHHPERARFLWNGRTFAEWEYPTLRTDVGAALPHRIDAERSGYLCRSRGDGAGRWFIDERIHLRFEFEGQTLRYPFQHDWFYPDDRGYPPLPDADRMRRTTGSTSVTQFRLTGCSDFNKFNRLVQAISGRGVKGGMRVLDWGVGCGRVARYFSAMPGIEFFGIDIDGDNVDWCRRHLPGCYLHVPLRPPIALNAGSFDLIYGISVLTHLREADQRAWLAELHRLAAPGGVVLVTFHGTTAADYAGLSPVALGAHLDRIEREGFVITSANDQIREFIDEPEYYVNVAHSTDYVRRVWGEYFDVVEIIPGMIATHDVAVLRKR